MNEIKKGKIAVIGAGISGLSAAWLLSKKHNVTVFEADKHFGGHANTVTAISSDGAIPVDTGFIVCNDRNYPNFLKLLDKLNIPLYPTEMSFGVSMDSGSFEYAGSAKLSSLIAQRRNIIRPRFWRMVRSILKFYEASQHIDQNIAEKTTLKDYIKASGYDNSFMYDHILPMAAAVWSTPSDKVGDFPLSSFLRFCQNHGLLQLKDRPQWFTIQGGSQEYVKALIQDTCATFHKNTAISEVLRTSEGIKIKTTDNKTEYFDRILIATHANTALKMLVDADEHERNILGKFHYAKNRAYLHSDPTFMPKRKHAWSSWNYIGNSGDKNHLSVTYWMNKLQPLKTEKPMFVTLNPRQKPSSVLTHSVKDYEHPIFDLDTLKAQKNLLKIMGYRNVWYAGAHFGYGFHEDGLQSGLFAAEQLAGISRPWHLPDMNNRILALEQGAGFNPQVDKNTRKAA